MASQIMSVNRLNVLMTVMIAFAFLVAELGNAVNGYPKFNQRPLPQYLLNVPPQKYCGEKLSSTLQTVCDSTYNSMYEENEQEEANTGHNFDYERNQEMEIDDYYPSTFEYPPYMHRSKTLKMSDSLFTRRRYRRESQGIYEECCLKACTISELSNYCAVSFQ